MYRSTEFKRTPLSSITNHAATEVVQKSPCLTCSSPAFFTTNNIIYPKQPNAECCQVLFLRLQTNVLFLLQLFNQAATVVFHNSHSLTWNSTAFTCLPAQTIMLYTTQPNVCCPSVRAALRMANTVNVLFLVQWTTLEPKYSTSCSLYLLTRHASVISTMQSTQLNNTLSILNLSIVNISAPVTCAGSMPGYSAVYSWSSSSLGTRPGSVTWCAASAPSTASPRCARGLGSWGSIPSSSSAGVRTWSGAGLGPSPSRQPRRLLPQPASSPGCRCRGRRGTWWRSRVCARPAPSQDLQNEQPDCYKS